MADALRAKLARSKSKNKRKRAPVAEEGGAGGAATMGAELAARQEMSSAAAWVKRSRTVPAARGRNDGHEDAGDGAEEEEKKKKKKTKTTANAGAGAEDGEGGYGSTDLEGLVIGHDVGAFKAGESVILTLADADVLDDSAGGPELTNANMADADRLRFRQDRARKLKQPLYAAYGDDDDEDDGGGGGAGEFGSTDGLVRKPRMLAQYDQEDDEQSVRDRRRVAIGSGGTINPAELQEAKRIAERMRAAQQGKTLASLHSAPLKVGRDYMTNEEVAAAASFKKKSKKKKKDKKKKKRKKKRSGLVEEDSDEDMLATGGRGGDGGGGGDGGMSLADELEARALSSAGGEQSSRGSRNNRASELSANPDLAEELQEHERQVRAFNAAMKRSWDAQKRSAMGAAGDGHGPGGGGGSTSSNNGSGGGAFSSEEELAAAMKQAREQDEAREAKRKADRLASQTGIGGINPDEGKLVFSSTVQFTDQLKSRILQMADEQAAAEARAAAKAASDAQIAAQVAAAVKQAEASATTANGAASIVSVAAKPQEEGEIVPQDDAASSSYSSLSSSQSLSSSSSSSNAQSAAAAQSSGAADPFARREPLASSGLAASLALLRRGNNLGDKSSGRSMAFSRTGAKSVKTEGADGGLKYEHRDSQGNLLSTKEAWRLQNYVFHGQNPGRKKMEKRKAILDAMQPKSQLDAQTRQTKALRARLKHSKQAHVKLNY